MLTTHSRKIINMELNSLHLNERGLGSRERSDCMVSQLGSWLSNTKILLTAFNIRVQEHLRNSPLVQRPGGNQDLIAVVKSDQKKPETKIKRNEK